MQRSTQSSNKGTLHSGSVRTARCYQNGSSEDDKSAYVRRTKHFWRIRVTAPNIGTLVTLGTKVTMVTTTILTLVTKPYKNVDLLEVYLLFVSYSDQNWIGSRDVGKSTKYQI